jgi:hypothetical protein
MSLKVGVIIFGSVQFLSKKSYQTKKKLKKNRNRFKLTGFGSVRFFRTKIDSNRFGSVFQFGSIFSVLARFFPVWLGFYDFARFGLDSVFLVFCL